MKASATCPRSFEAEAMRDGRLGEAERAKFERHAMTCAACSSELRAMEALARSLRDDSGGDVDELHVKRERTRLLAAFDRALVVPERSVLRRHVVLAAVVVATLVIVVGWRMRSSSSPSPLPSASVVASSEVRPAAETVWSKRAERNREAVVLERGTLAIRVSHAPGAPAMVVLLPDGELEDTGTTFTVSAENGRTTRVDVTEGSVVLRLRGQSAVTIAAGESWHATSLAPHPAVASAIPSELVAKEEPSLVNPAPSNSGSARPRTSVTLDASADFRAAMALFDSGESTRAAAEFARFAALHPHDSRVEDAVYLRVIALQRSGDAGATKGAALEYLRRFPEGFRRAEVEPLAR